MDQVERLQLFSMSRMLSQLLQVGPEGGKSARHNRTSLQALNSAMALRANFRKREERLSFLPSCNPGWKILIELYICNAEHRPISITDIGHACTIPVATALRWIDLLTENKLIVRVPDSTDKRRTWVHLTSQGQTTVEEILIDLTTRMVANADTFATA